MGIYQGGIYGPVSDTAYDATAWDGVTTIAPSKNAVRDKVASLESLVTEINVLKYGAVGDGVADDTAGVQAAIDAAEAAGSGLVYFPPGTYSVSGLRIETGNVHLTGPGATIFHRSASATHLIAIAATAQWVRITNLVLDGNKAGQSATRYGVHYETWSGGLREADRCLIDSCIIKDTKGSGVRVETGRLEVRISRCSVRGSDTQGIILLGTDNVVENCAIGVCGTDGIYINNQANRILNNNVYTCASAGIRVTGTARHTQIIGNELDQNDAYDIYCIGSGGQTIDTVIAANLFRSKSTVNTEGTYPFIHLEQVRAITITGNLSSIITGKYDASYGVYVGAGVNDVVMSGNWWEPLSLGTGETNDATKFRQGFYGTSPVTKPAVTGSRAGNAALASLLTQLASQGLITDSTTV